MSLKATKVALEVLKSMSEHGSVNHGVACRAEKEIAALEKAAAAIHVCYFGKERMDIDMDFDAATKRSAFALMASIAREAP